MWMRGSAGGKSGGHQDPRETSAPMALPLMLGAHGGQEPQGDPGAKSERARRGEGQVGANDPGAKKRMRQIDKREHDPGATEQTLTASVRGNSTRNIGSERSGDESREQGDSVGGQERPVEG